MPREDGDTEGEVTEAETEVTQGKPRSTKRRPHRKLEKSQRKHSPGTLDLGLAAPRAGRE